MIKITTTEYELHDAKGPLGTIELSPDDRLEFVPGCKHSQTAQQAFMGMIVQGQQPGPHEVMTYSLESMKEIVAAWEELLKREYKKEQANVE